MLVLRTIHHAEEITFVPHLSVTLGVLLAVVSVGVLIYFIHHVSVSIQASEIVARVATELIKGIERLFPENIGEGAPRISAEPPGADFLDRFELEACPVPSAGDGYLQFVDGKALLALAMQEDVVILLKRRPGHYVVANQPLVLIWPGTKITDQLMERVKNSKLAEPFTGADARNRAVRSLGGGDLSGTTKAHP